jgi:hypothetical protein
MRPIAESDRFQIEDEGDGWITLQRRGADSMSIRTTEVTELIELLRGFRVVENDLVS